MLKLAALLLTYAGFALFQAVASGHPLDRMLANRAMRLRRHARPLARLAAVVCVVAACALLASAIGWAEAALFSAVVLVLIASLFVLMAPVLPRIAWGLAIASPVLAGALVTIGSRSIP